MSEEGTVLAADSLGTARLARLGAATSLGQSRRVAYPTACDWHLTTWASRHISTANQYRTLLDVRVYLWCP